MKIAIVGGGPAGLYFAILMKKRGPTRRVTVFERNRADDTFGFGVVFSDATLANLARADPDTHAQITRSFAHWDAIDTHVRGELHTSAGHGFCGLERKELLLILQRRCAELGVETRFLCEAPDLDEARAGTDLLVGADGVASGLRGRWAEQFGPEIDLRGNRFVWLGTSFPFQAFTFYFKESAHGMFRVHAYRYSSAGSTFIVECTGDTFARTGLAEADEDGTIAYLERLFAAELAGHRLIKNRSIWRQFPTVTNRSWHFENAVLLGDAAHTAHFSIGSGTKLAMEDAIALADAVDAEPVARALPRYERERRTVVERTQRAAQVSLEWFEGAERYLALPPLQFTFSLLTRSLRLSRENLRVRDPELVAQLDTWFAGGARGIEPWRVALELGALKLPGRLVVAGQARPAWAEAGAVGLALCREGEAGERGAPRALVCDAESGKGAGSAASESGAALILLDAGEAAPERLEAALRRARPGAGGCPLAARVVATEESVLAQARAARAGGAVLLAVAAAPGACPAAGDLAAAQLADRARQEAGIPTLVEAPFAGADEVDTALLAGRADLCLVTQPTNPRR